MAITDYYGDKSSTTKLDIYSTDGINKTIHRSLEDQEAYDTWHLAMYFKEILECRKMLNEKISFNSISRKEKHLFVQLLLASSPDIQSVTELGSSLFEMIDGMELLNKYARQTASDFPTVNLKNISFTGVELSSMLTEASKHLHQNYKLNIFTDIYSLPEENKGLLYDRNVTSYVFDNTPELVSFINRYDIAYCNIYFNKEKTFHGSRLGKKHTYFSLEEFIKLTDKPLYHLFGTRAPGPQSGEDLTMGNDVIEGFFICCSPQNAENFMKRAKSIPEVKAWFEEKSISLKEASALL